jgi:hypothetical protein
MCVALVRKYFLLAIHGHLIDFIPGFPFFPAPASHHPFKQNVAGLCCFLSGGLWQATSRRRP